MADEMFLPVVSSSSVGVGLVFLFTLPSIRRLALFLSSSTKETGPIALQEVYQDEDGIATIDSQAACSDWLPKILVRLATVLGFAVSIASAVLKTVGKGQTPSSWMIVGWEMVVTWALLSIQVLCVSVERSFTARFMVATYGAVSTIAILAMLFVQNVYAFTTVMLHHGPQRNVHLGLAVAQICFAVMALVACLLFPRRPAVYLADGKPVDEQFAVSLFSRLTFAWNQSFLDLSSQRTVQLEDLPRPAHQTRASAVQQSFNSKLRPGSLWKSIFFAHYTSFLSQLTLSVVHALLGFAPQLSLFKLLSLLEARTGGQEISHEMWIWVSFLGLGLVFMAWFESWMIWVSLSELFLPIRAELNASVFQKAMRKKDVKEIKKAKSIYDSGETDTKLASGSSDPGKQSKNAESVEEEKAAEPKLKQSTVNLIGLDARRVSEFSSAIRQFPDTFVDLVVSLAFLLVLIGWKPLISGFVCFLLVIPLSTWSTRKFGVVQDQLMEVRDEKTELVREALGALRQIKFSALENQWQAKIAEVRARELSLLRWQYVIEALMEVCWILGPLLLSTVSLSVYAYLEGKLTPSVAFTSLGVFYNTNGALNTLPELFTMGSAAWTSLGRVQNYLESPEMDDQLTYGESICFENASLAWPVDDLDEAEQGRFVLRNVNVAFPPGELSVISGETGCGKSLMLASIIGESGLLSGVARVPSPVLPHERYDYKATSESWILPSVIAYVAQIPWIENATIRQNILFGLPFDQIRYQKTLWACALTKDLDMLTDGDSTEIGPNGINLSGGQRWRVTLARALYSRAGILVLDDIFSAVDAHVGKWIFEKALTGDLGRGRTRILATHHTAICIAKTAYAVHLDDGTIKHAGPVEELRRTGELTEILEVDESSAEDTQGQGLSSADAQELPTFVDGKATAGDVTDAQPKKFVKDEHREEGRVKGKVYLEYCRAAGGFVLWTLALLLFVVSQTTDVSRSYWVKVWSGSYEERSARNVSYEPELDTDHTSPVEPTFQDNGNFGFYFPMQSPGRFGAVMEPELGKSSLALALFRLLEARQGSITIDGIDISKIKLHDLRSRLAIIPQDPKIFSGTIRSNLDPFTQFTDAELHAVLQRVHLTRPQDNPPHQSTTTTTTTTPHPETNTNIFATLSSPISPGDLNLSQGQRQLLCLARALLQRANVMVLDEATSAVDMETDAKIQRSIREEFRGSTLLVIAHRLSTVADFDKVLVMADGRVVEEGGPKELLLLGGGGRKGAFAGMVADSGDREGIRRLVFGEG